MNVYLSIAGMWRFKSWFGIVLSARPLYFSGIHSIKKSLDEAVLSISNHNEPAR